MRGRPVNKISSSGEVVATYRSATKAAVQNGIDRSVVWRYCSGKYKGEVASDGFIYRWSDDPTWTDVEHKGELVYNYTMNFFELNGFIIDADTYEMISKYLWRADKAGYAVTSTYCIETKKRSSMKMHRVIMNAQKGQIVDHINGNVKDNRKVNLRFVTASQSTWNTTKKASCTSKYKGVSFTKMKTKYKDKVFIHDRWRAKLFANNIKVFDRLYKTELEAAKAYDEAARKYHGEFARTNFQD